MAAVPPATTQGYDGPAVEPSAVPAAGDTSTGAPAVEQPPAPFQAVTSQLLIRQFNLQQLLFLRRMVQLPCSAPFLVQGMSILLIEFPTDVVDLRSRTIKKSWCSR
ncbi:hypothetical protein ACUV84_026711 [Puccinellia chinampoensis]